MLNFVERVEITFEETMSIFELLEYAARGYNAIGKLTGMSLADSWISIIHKLLDRNHDTATFNKVASYWPGGLYNRLPVDVLSKNGKQIYAGENNVAFWRFKDHSILAVFDTRCEVYRPLRGLKDESKITQPKTVPVRFGDVEMRKTNGDINE